MRDISRSTGDNEGIANRTTIARCPQYIKLLDSMLLSSLKKTILGLVVLLLSAAPVTAQIVGNPQQDDHFDNAVATGDFYNDGVDDIGAGVPGEEVDGAAEAGAVNAIYHVFSGTCSDLWIKGAMPVAIEPEAPRLPTSFALRPAYPNPFNPSATPRYNVPEAGLVRITVFDVLGGEIALL